VSDRDQRSGPSRRALWDERHAARDPIESFEPDPTLVDEIGSLRPGRALDLGAGDGRNAIWLASQGWHVTAVDFSQVALDRGRALATARGVRVEWQLADLLEWSPGASRFDLVTLFFIHLPPDERRDVYARAAAAVAPGGTLLIVGHDRTNLADGVGGPQDPHRAVHTGRGRGRPGRLHGRPSRGRATTCPGRRRTDRRDRARGQGHRMKDGATPCRGLRVRPLAPGGVCVAQPGGRMSQLSEARRGSPRG
jgi:SAM-dependent methyltransferase